ncbi:MAG: gamma-glutamyl-gamma-aminobutyrate hydrolase family protein [Pseudomonadota bacterium]
MAKAPIVIVTTDTVFHRHMNWSGSPQTYCEALAQVGVVPLQMPTTTTPYDLDALVDIASGVLLTGARSNVHPARYGATPTEDAEPHDLARDAQAFGLIEAARARDLPMLGICRGFQEMNVAYGGTLVPRVDDLPDRGGHHTMPEPDVDNWFRLKHDVDVRQGGILAGILGAGPTLVNSAHFQGALDVGEGLRVEALAADGTVEAFCDPTRTFCLGVQWHPEHWVASDPASRAVMQAFADAVKAHASGGAQRKAA